MLIYGWVERVQIFTVNLKKVNKQAQKRRIRFNRNPIKAIEHEYNEIMAYANIQCPPQEKIKPKKQKDNEKVLISLGTLIDCLYMTS